MHPGRSGLRLLGTSGALLGGTAIVAAGAALAIQAGDTAARHLKVQPTRNPVSAEISFLSSVACPSRRACTAVGGSSRSLSSTSRTLAEHWNGSRWSLQSIPTPRGTSDSLYGVACPSTRACMAVGGAFHTTGRRQTALSEAWDGRRWRVVPTPSVRGPSSLYGISCRSAWLCVAVGHTLNSPQLAVIERWNGRTWSVEAIPPLAGDTELAGVSCSGARACVAVGWNNATGNTRPLALSWNGRVWWVQAVPLPQAASPGSSPARAGVLDGVSCTSANACTATGTDFGPPGGPTLAERWNGRTWRVQPTPNPPNWSTSLAEVTLDGVSCASARACTAIGEYNPGHVTAYFIESWNGRRWVLQPAPHPADFAHGALMGVSCTTARCTAVGAYTGRVRLQVTLALGG